MDTSEMFSTYKDEILRIRKNSCRQRWNIAFINESLDDILSTDKKLTFNFLKQNPEDNNRWFADPFILDVDEKNIYLLVEDFNCIKGFGHISKLTINKKDYILEKVDTVLQLDTHLSFPAILRRDDKIYIYPENYESGKLNLYEYNKKENTCNFIKTLCDRPLTDAIISNSFGKDIIISTEFPHSNKNIFGIYNGNELVTECYTYDNTARNGGDWFEYKNKLYRVAQNCNHIYGEEVIIQQVLLSDSEFIFKNIRRIKPEDTYFSCHTFNHYKGISVTDFRQK